MSFAIRRAAFAAPRAFQARTFVATPAAFKTVTETVKEAAATANRVAGDAALKAVEGGEAVRDSVKNVTGQATSSDAATEAKKAGADVSNKAGKAFDDAKTEAYKVKEDVKNAANKQ